MPRPFAGSGFIGLGHHSPFSDNDDFGFGFSHMRDPFKNIEKQMKHMSDSFGSGMGGSEGQSKSFSSSYSSETGKDGQVHSKQSKEGQ